MVVQGKINQQMLRKGMLRVKTLKIIGGCQAAVWLVVVTHKSVHNMTRTRAHTDSDGRI